jgi:transposase
MANRSRRTVESSAGSKTEPVFELTDEQWNLISDLFPDKRVGPKGGRPSVKSRPCVEGILWILRTGARWRDLPKRFPSSATCWRRLKEWTEAGIWDTAWGRLLRKLDRRGAINHGETIADGTFSSAKKGVNASARPNAVRAPRPWCSSTGMACPCRPSSPAPVLPK